MTSDFLVMVVGQILFLVAGMWITYYVGWVRGYREASRIYSNGLTQMTTEMKKVIQK